MKQHLRSIAATAVWLAVIGAARARPGDLLPPFPIESGVKEKPATAAVPLPGLEKQRQQDDIRTAKKRAEEFARKHAGAGSDNVPRRAVAPPAPATQGPAAPPAAPAATPAGSRANLLIDRQPAGEPGPAAPVDPSKAPGNAHPLLPDVPELPDTPPESQLSDSASDGLPALPVESGAETTPAANNLLPGENGTPPPVAPESPDDNASEVPRSELGAVPMPGDVADQERRGPVFRVSGAEAFMLARSRGYKFTPAGGLGLRDGNHTVAAQYPNVMTSEVHGTSMRQHRPPVGWAIAETSNTFFMFCDPAYQAVPLAPGWRVRGIQLRGPAWQWVACPRSGASTASFSIRIHGYRHPSAPESIVDFTGLTLEGPEGATDWREAFLPAGARRSDSITAAKPSHGPQSIKPAE